MDDNANSRIEIVGTSNVDELLAEIAAKRKARHDPCVVKPGSQHAADAARAGVEDEYADRMKYRFGDEW